MLAIGHYTPLCRPSLFVLFVCLFCFVLFCVWMGVCVGGGVGCGVDVGVWVCVFFFFFFVCLLGSVA